MNGKTSIVDKAIVCGRTYAARCSAARSGRHLVCAESVCGFKEKMKKMSSPVPVHPLLYADFICAHVTLRNAILHND